MKLPPVIRRALGAHFGVHWYYSLLLAGMAILFFVVWKQGPSDLANHAANIAKAHASGGIARTHDYAAYWTGVVARAGFFTVLGLFLIAPWLAASGAPPRTTASLPARPVSPRWFWPAVLVVMLASAVANRPRLGHSFWFDEESTARRFVVGDASATGRPAPPKWERTLFYYNDPNNHPLCSALGRLSHELAGVTASGPGDFPFRESIIRLPSFLAGLGALAALAWLAAVVERPRAGLIAVLLLALHPWYVRYSVELRGYALVLVILPLLLGCLVRGLRTGRLGWFLGFGLLEFLFLWSYPGVLYSLLLVNLAALGWIVLGDRDALDRGSRWIVLRRLSAGNLAGALLSVLALAPLVQPMLAYLRSERMSGRLNLEGVLEVASGLLSGVPWAPWADHERAVALSRTLADSPVAASVLLGGVIAALVVGMVTVIRMPGPFRWIGPAVVATAPFMVMMTALQGNILYPWYVIPALPGFVLVAGIGLDTVLSRIANPVAAATALALILLGAVLGTWRQNSLLRRFPIEPMRESVQAMRPVVNSTLPAAGETLSASLCYPARLYDPLATPVKSAEELNALMDQAVAGRKPLVVNFANIRFARTRYPEVMALLERSDLFLADPPFPGTHAQPERWVFRFRATLPATAPAARPLE